MDSGDVFGKNLSNSKEKERPRFSDFRSDKGESYFFQMKSVIGKGSKAKIGDKVTYHLKKGFDSKKNKSVMNAVNIKIMG